MWTMVFQTKDRVSDLIEGQLELKYDFTTTKSVKLHVERFSKTAEYSQK